MAGSAIGSLSPIIVTQLQYPEAPTPAERAKYRGRVTKQVLGCQACELHKVQECGHPIPFQGSHGARIIVVGEAPDVLSTKAISPFAGPARRLFTALLSDAGFEVDDVYCCNTVSCFPNVEGKGRGATETESLACRGNLLDQLEAAYLPYVVVAGGRALHAFRSDLTVTQHHGGIYVWNDRFIVMPIFHPGAALQHRAYKEFIREDLTRFNDIISSGDDPLTFIGETCFKCKMDATWWDRDGVPMCDEHYKKWGKQWEKERKRWTEHAAVQLTL